ncbi:MAG: hypothetical protein H6976_08795 [Gammaproteobacteria bacterium]|nr:hypothetical protein [Gammaproteobacteria bacterium]
MDIWKLIGALVITTALTIGGAYAFSWLGWIADLQPKAWLILLVSTLGILFKLLFGDLATGEFQYHKHGYDLCVLSMGATMSSLSLQLVTDINLFSGIQSTSPILLAKTFTNDAIQQSRVLLFTVFLFASFSTLLTARVSKAIRFDSTKGKNILSLLNFSIGAAMLGWYVLILVARG